MLNSCPVIYFMVIFILGMSMDVSLSLLQMELLLSFTEHRVKYTYLCELIKQITELVSK